MNVHTLDHHTMEATRKLAEINGEISTGKATLEAMKRDLNAFLQERAILEQERLVQVFEDSKELVAEIGKEYETVTAYYNEIRSFSKFLQELQNSFNEEIHLFEEAKQASERHIKGALEEIAIIRDGLQKEREIMAAERAQNVKRQKELSAIQAHIKSQQESLKATIKHYENRR